jgi:hypothetical protein
MAISCVRCGTIVLTLLVVASTSFAVPVPAAKSATIKDRANYIPKRKHVPLPGKIVALLLPDAQAILNLEGRSGPTNQLCIGYNGGSYRWVYVQVKERPMIGSLMVRVGDKGDRKRFDNLSLATPETVKQFGIKGRYALVEVEVNGGLGSPADDSFVATKMRQLDDTKEFPFKLDDVIANLRQQYEQRVKDQVREIDSGMAKAATEAIKDRKATGPRERAEVMFVTWLPETKRLRVHFRTTISDGEYKYAGGVNIYLGGARTMKAGAPIALATRKAGSSVRQYGLRYGTQFGIDFGTAYEVSPSGKIEKTLTLPLASFSNEIKEPPIFNRGGVGTRAFRTVPTARVRR